MKPKILLSAKTRPQFYVDAVEGCGGIATSKYCPEFSTDYDGLILCGGSDVSPSYYGEEINGSVNIDNDRDRAEFALAKAFTDLGKPVMGICRGCQLLNIFLEEIFVSIFQTPKHTLHLATETLFIKQLQWITTL